MPRIFDSYEPISNTQRSLEAILVKFENPRIRDELMTKYQRIKRGERTYQQEWGIMYPQYQEALDDMFNVED